MLKVQEIRELIKLVDQSAIDEFTYESEGTTVTMKKSGSHSAPAPVVQEPKPVERQAEPTVVQEPKVQAEEKKEAVHTETVPKEEVSADFDYEIVSPMVGTMYSSPNPESDAYVSKGSKVEKDTVVCIVEAMKLFNEIEAEVSGEIVEILVEDGELVEYGQPLFRVKKK
ncbi:acetyl-CoA carboxylase biotin carboxyl carrier protein [Virgibacillus siamensis]|uniref:acetyl-CoA carboxylase biotin carboxyl carrier protein n=1 Tax=Virgibacillus siamensis TaxID=480071 RepID=UPI00098701C0|nr:acetyl-CoA carboxylase biotin carboxyl carrier protein [Virgibacillus siamensis]